MALALGHPTHGYYPTREPLGAAGDFVTAPEIGQRSASIIGLWPGRGLAGRRAARTRSTWSSSGRAMAR